MTNSTVRDAYLGQIIDGRYRVVSRIARGGMATVYRAMDLRLDREVALKIMHTHLTEGTSGQAFITRFRREARSAARLNHPNVVGVFDQGATPEVNYLAMELIEGENLRQRLARGTGLSVSESFEVVSGVLQALVAAENQGIVHRDIKPENILLTSDDTVKVADFGLARAVTEVSATTTGTILGTVAYVGPELITSGQSDIRTDIYAVGILLYELLTGRQPYTGQTPIQVAFQHVNSNIPAASEHAQWLPEQVNELISTLSAREPDERPQDAATALALVGEVGKTISGEVASQRPVVAVLPDAEEAAPAEPTPLAGPPGHGSVARDADETTVIGEVGGQTLAMDLTPEELGVTGLSGPINQANVTASITAHRRVTRRDLVRQARTRRRIIWSVVIGLLVAIAGVSFWWWWTGSGPGSYTQVPNDVANMQPAALEEMLTELKLKATFDEAYHDSIAEGRVITTSPGPGEKIRRGETVEILVSLGIKMLTIPDGLTGMAQQEAMDALTDLGFPAPLINSQHHDEVPAGDVIDVSHEAGSALPHDTSITLTVSQGPAPVEIPNVEGETSRSAQELLKGLGLIPKTSEAHSDNVPEGSVISQDPIAGTQGQRTDSVNLVISLGPELIEVPNIPLHANYEEAKKELEKIGFRVERKAEWGGTFNAVVGQSLNAGDKVPKGSTIVLTVI